MTLIKNNRCFTRQSNGNNSDATAQTLASGPIPAPKILSKQMGMDHDKVGSRFTSLTDLDVVGVEISEGGEKQTSIEGISHRDLRSEIGEDTIRGIEGSEL